MADEITITANGEKFTLASGTALTEFLIQRKLRPEQVIVERNHEALTPSEAQDTVLQAGDSLEIVRIVAGG